MRYASAGALRRALDMRLATHARETGRSVVRLRKGVAFDRLLARLFAVAPERWVLKGALALDYRFGDRARTTKDVDLACAGDEASTTGDLLAAQAVDLGDFFGFAIERTSALDRMVGGSDRDPRGREASCLQPRVRRGFCREHASQGPRRPGADRDRGGSGRREPPGSHRDYLRSTREP